VGDEESAERGHRHEARHLRPAALRPFPETSSAFRRTYAGQEIFHSYVAKP